MSLFAHHAGSAHLVRDFSFELVQARYVAAPALMWLAAICGVMLLTAAQSQPARLASHVPSTEAAGCFSHGA